MDDELLTHLVPFLALAVAPTERVGTEDEYYLELERLSANLNAVCHSEETREVITDITEIVRGLAWAIDEVTGSDAHSRWLIEHGNHRTWSLDDEFPDSDPCYVNSRRARLARPRPSEPVKKQRGIKGLSAPFNPNRHVWGIGVHRRGVGALELGPNESGEGHVVEAASAEPVGQHCGLNGGERGQGCFLCVCVPLYRRHHLGRQGLVPVGGPELHLDPGAVGGERVAGSDRLVRIRWLQSGLGLVACVPEHVSSRTIILPKAELPNRGPFPIWLGSGRDHRPDRLVGGLLQRSHLHRSR